MQQHPLIKEYLDITFRRRWWIVVPSLLGVLFALALFFKFQKLYKADTRVRFREQSVSRRLLDPIIEINPADQVTSITAEIVSEKYVQELEQRLHLVGTPNGPRNLTELTQKLTGNIDVAPNVKNHFFDLTVTWSDPRIAASVANELADIYIRRNQEIRQDLADTTVDQLRKNRQSIEKDLLEIRARIEKFRGEHKFELATQQPTNLSQIANDRAEIERLDTRIRDAKSQIEKIELTMQIPVLAMPGQRDIRAEELQRLRNEREGHLARGMKPQHPTLRKLEGQIASLEAELGVSSEKKEGGGPPPMSASDLSHAQLEQQKRQWEEEITVAQSKQTQLLQEIEQLKIRLDRTPDWQIELDKMETEERQLAQKYEDAQGKENTASQGAQVEQFNQGERFEILNNARPPTEPFWPDLKLFLLMGLAVGGGVGVAMILLLEVFDQSFKSEEQLAASIDMPILAVIPDLTRAPRELERPRVKSSKRRKAV
jgi:polysaccharide biosynthesis transport protein